MKWWIYKIPQFKGKFRLVRFFFSKTLNNTKNCTLSGKLGLQYTIPNLKENIGFEIFANGIYEKDTSDLIVSSLPPNGVFIDIGANIGCISLPVSQARPDVKIICVEASKKIFEYLKKNIAINNLKNFTLVHNAISDQDNKTISFHTSELFGKGSMTVSHNTQTETIQTITIDSLVSQLGLQEVSLIKIDIEGYELSALQGAKNILQRTDAPDIIFEFIDYAEESNSGVPAGSAQKYLTDLGYSLFTYRRGGRLKLIDEPIKKGEEMLFATKMTS